MADETKKETVTLQELMVSTLAMTDADKATDREGRLYRRGIQSQIGHRALELFSRLKALALTPVRALQHLTSSHSRKACGSTDTLVADAAIILGNGVPALT
jgi:hypothetical protein